MQLRLFFCFVLVWLLPLGLGWAQESPKPRTEAATERLAFFPAGFPFTGSPGAEPEAASRLLDRPNFQGHREQDSNEANAAPKVGNRGQGHDRPLHDWVYCIHCRNYTGEQCAVRLRPGRRRLRQASVQATRIHILTESLHLVAPVHWSFQLK